jgi:uncharacterized coiled-coil protein SlyX
MDNRAKEFGVSQRRLIKAEKTLACKHKTLAKANAKVAACRATVEDMARRTPSTTS